MTTAEQIRNTCTQWMEAFNRHDAEALAACYSEDGVHYNPIAPEPVRGRQAISQFFNDFLVAFPDASIEFPRVIVEEGRAAVESVVRGTQQGTLRGGSQCPFLQVAGGSSSAVYAPGRRTRTVRS